MMHNARISVIGSIVVLVAASAACERPKAPVNGIGGFQLGKTKLRSLQAAANARCFDAEGKAKCLIMARQAIAQRTPQMQLEFSGTQPDALLGRIVLEIPGCNLDDVRVWFENRLDAPTEKIADAVLWQQKYMVLSLYISGPSRCQVIAIDPDDEPGVQALLKPYAPKPPAGSPAPGSK